MMLLTTTKTIIKMLNVTTNNNNSVNIILLNIFVDYFESIKKEEHDTNNNNNKNNHPHSIVSIRITKDIRIILIILFKKYRSLRNKSSVLQKLLFAIMNIKINNMKQYYIFYNSSFTLLANDVVV